MITFQSISGHRLHDCFRPKFTLVVLFRSAIIISFIYFKQELTEKKIALKNFRYPQTHFAMANEGKRLCMVVKEPAGGGKIYTRIVRHH